MQKKGQRGESHEKENSHPHRTADPAEKAAIERRAKQANMTVTDYIVKCALGKNVRQTDELAPILSELKAQGRNLNQLTKLANMGRITLVDAENFTETYTNLYGLIEEIYWEVE